jgi:D-aspartate ligase
VGANRSAGLRSDLSGTAGIAVVAAADSVGALAAIRSLGRAGVRVIAVHQAPDALGFRSRYAERWICPDPRDDEQGFVDSLVALGERLGGPVPIFPVADPHLYAIARNFDRLRDRFLLSFPEPERLERLRDKRFQVELAAQAGLQVPRTVDTPDDDLVYPVLVKSSDSARFVDALGVKAVRCDSRSELDQAYARALPFNPHIQEWIPGPDQDLYLAGAYLNATGEVLGVVTCRKVQQVPPEVGTIRVGEAFPSPEIADLAVAFLREARCYGPSDVEFKLDRRDGRFKFIEMNPRLVQWQGLASAAGVDIALLAYHDLIGASPPAAQQRSARTRWAITFLTGSGHERPGLGGSGPVFTKLPYTDAVFAPGDPWPAVVQIGKIVRGLGRRFTRRP